MSGDIFQAPYALWMSTREFGKPHVQAHVTPRPNPRTQLNKQRGILPALSPPEASTWTCFDISHIRYAKHACNAHATHLQHKCNTRNTCTTRPLTAQRAKYFSMSEFKSRTAALQLHVHCTGFHTSRTAWLGCSSIVSTQGVSRCLCWHSNFSVIFAEHSSSSGSSSSSSSPRIGQSIKYSKPSAKSHQNLLEG